MQPDHHSSWTAFHATLAQENRSGPSELFNQANPGAAPATGTGTQPAGTAPPTGGGSPGGSMNFMLIMGLLLVLMLVLPSLANRKQKRARTSMLAAMKKYDRVLTIGGMIGTVVELRDDEVVLKVDEHSNTKVRFTRSAIQQVLRPSTDAEAASGSADAIEVKAKGEGVGAKN